METTLRFLRRESGLLAYFFYMLQWGFFLLVLVPVVYGGALYGLLRLGFPPDVIDVWGLAVLGGTAVLLLFKCLDWTVWKLRGSPSPSPAPEPPRWVRVAFGAGLWGTGLAAGVGLAFVGVLFLTIGPWPKLDAAGDAYLGELEVAAAPAGPGFTVSFIPRGGYWQVAIEDLPLPEAEFLAVGVRRVSLEGPTAQVLSKLGLGSCVFPWGLHQKVTSEAEGMRVAALLEGRNDFVLENVLAAVAFLPGARVESLLCEWQPVTGPGRFGVELRGGELVLGAAREPDPDTPPPPTDTPSPTSPRPEPTGPPTGEAGDEPGGPGDGPGPTEPTPPPLPELPTDDTGVPLVLYPGDPRDPGSPGDPFEGLD